MRTEYVERVTGIFEKERHSRNCHSTIAVLLSELVFTIYICLRGEKKISNNQAFYYAVIE